MKFDDNNLRLLTKPLMPFSKLDCWPPAAAPSAGAAPSVVLVVPVEPEPLLAFAAISFALLKNEDIVIDLWEL